MKNKIALLFMIVLILCFADFSNAQIASGGTFSLEQTVIASGGGTSVDSNMGRLRIEGTTGQSAAGSQMSGGTFTQVGGFWQPIFSPTAAEVQVRGRVIRRMTKGKGIGIKNAFVTITGGTSVTPRVVHTNSFGYFSFENIEIGYTYIVTVRHKSYSFIQNSIVFNLLEVRDDLLFQAF